MGQELTFWKFDSFISSKKTILESYCMDFGPTSLAVNCKNHFQCFVPLKCLILPEILPW